MFKFSKLPQSHPLFFLKNTNQSLELFTTDVNLYRKRIQHYRTTCNEKVEPTSSALSVVLYHPDPYQFCVRLFALSLESADIYFPSNGQVQSISSFVSNVDVFSGQIEHELTLQSLESNEVTECYDEAITTLSNVIKWPDKGNLYFSTSGSTGQAKLVHKTWQQINLELLELQNSFNITSELKIVSTVSHQHIYGLLFRLLWPLSVGSLISDTFEYPEHVNAALETGQKVTLISSPAFLKRLASDNVLIAESAKLSHVFSSGGMLVDEVAVLLRQQLNLSVIQVYGSTETGGIAYRQVDSLPASQWQTFSGISLDIEEESQRLILQSPWVRESPLLLDDIGELNSSSQFTLKGRADRTVKLEEKRINLTTMESVANDHPWIKESRILLKQGKRDLLFAVISLTEQGLGKHNELSRVEFTRVIRNHLLRKFELVCLPKKWRFLNELPYNSQGKLVQRELEKLFE